MFKLDECLHDHPSMFQPSEFQAVQNLKKAHAAGKISSFNAVLTWSKKTEGGGDLRPSPDPRGDRASGFLAQDSYEFDFMSSSTTPTRLTM